MDKNTRDILESGQMKLNDPGFNMRVMRAIEDAQFAKMKRQLFLTWFFFILTVEILIGLAIWTSGLTLENLAVFPYTILDGIQTLLSWMVHYQYIILPLAVILILKRIIDFGLRHS